MEEGGEKKRGDGMFARGVKQVGDGLAETFVKARWRAGTSRFGNNHGGGCIASVRGVIEKRSRVRPRLGYRSPRCPSR